MVKSDKDRRFYFIDLLRGFAALSILFWHYQHFYYIKASQSTLIDKSIQPFYKQLSLFYEHGGEAVQLLGHIWLCFF